MDPYPPTFVAADPPPPAGDRAPDPGSPLAAKVAWLLAIVFVLTTVLMNQLGERPTKAGPQTPAEHVVEAPGLDPVTLNSKIWVKLANSLPFQQAEREMGMTQIDEGAQTIVDRFRAAIVAGELLGEDAAIKRLAEVESQDADAETPTPGLTADIELYRSIIDSGPASASPEDRARFETRHGWFARVASVYGLPETDPDRSKIVSGGGLLIATIALFGLGFLAVVVLAIVMCILMSVRLARGGMRPAFIPPAPGGSVYLEVLPFFVALFALFKLSLTLIVFANNHVMPDWLNAASLAGQWLLLLAPLYPLLRGVGWAEHRRAMGWHSGEGFWREVRAGLFSYFAALPLLALAGAITVCVVVARQLIMKNSGWPDWLSGQHALMRPIVTLIVLGGVFAVVFALAYVIQPRSAGRARPVNAAVFGGIFAIVLAVTCWQFLTAEEVVKQSPIAELLEGSSLLELFLLFTLATIWAPLVEESIFRGAFFRHLRSRFGLFASAAVSAIAFGVMHPIGLLLMLPVTTLGFAFALTREWRGSLIGPMAGHALHNAMILTMAISLLRQLAD